MMTQSSTTASAVASNLFQAQLSKLPNVSYSTSNVTVNVVDTVAATGLNRTATLNYTANSNNLFTGVIGMSTLPIAGTSQSKNGISPKINFYMLLDTSPSMEIAATTAGISTMVSHTSSQGGCAFGCHETNPSADNLGNPGGEDNYTLARNAGRDAAHRPGQPGDPEPDDHAPSTATAEQHRLSGRPSIRSTTTSTRCRP